MIEWTYTPSSKEDEEEKSPDTVRDPAPCEVCTYYSGYLTECLGVDPDEEDGK
jgi:hypothetical protein